jgi:hypothetical protein
MNSFNSKSITSITTLVGIGLVFGSSVDNANAFMSYPQMHIPQATSYLRPNDKTKKVQISLQDKFLSSNEIVKWLKNEGLPIALIAEITFVERKSVYAWLNGGAIRPHNQERLEKIYTLLNENKIADLRNLYRFWSRVIPNQRPLSLLFQDKDLEEKSIKLVLSHLWPLAEKEQKREFAKQLSSEQIKSNAFLRDIREVTSSYES